MCLAFKYIWWNHKMYLPALVLGDECLLRGLGLILQGVCTRQVFSTNSHASSTQTKRSVEEPAYQLCTQRTSIAQEQKTSVWEQYVANSLHELNFIIWKKGAARWEEQNGLLQSCFSACEMEKFGWIVLFSHVLSPSITQCLKSHRDSCSEHSLVPENLNFC